MLVRCVPGNRAPQEAGARTSGHGNGSGRSPAGFRVKTLTPPLATCHRRTGQGTLRREPSGHSRARQRIPASAALHDAGPPAASCARIPPTAVPGKRAQPGGLAVTRHSRLNTTPPAVHTVHADQPRPDATRLKDTHSIAFGSVYQTIAPPFAIALKDKGVPVPSIAAIVGAIATAPPPNAPSSFSAWPAPGHRLPTHRRPPRQGGACPRPS